ncbi:MULTISPECIES: LysE/ArgO family amino acid transporter [Vibrio]|uniref:LysE/ArgO family amino acid transporter n=1 Tax=Vibrio TaxID=662 RepID=UPI0003000E73|nr:MULTISPECIES: LysE/ArgO family amino acid transporter [Vibrio]ERM60930.1 Transporter, LysE family [Vibrio cyclitrophicus FF75]KAA8600248.1 Arginine exporter protein ArgO [Vibrio cyclitrophicus]MBE8556353.1 amino acid transporter [Vibrio sp. OPT24]MBU2933183.1 LysE/ArgO family amino acid transporter [Vibrio cyclitrophicus]MDH5880629.1 LysE/ArgO family amino acid transporter [Vibrio sp. S/42/10]
MSTYFAGFTLGLSLILAIGSQNAFVLKQGLKNQHVFAICLVCAISDALLISFGVTGFGAIVKQFPQIEQFARYGGAVFLGVYAFLSLRSSFTETHALEGVGDTKESLIKAMAMCLAFTWLNPHVYLDTVVLLGSISTQYQPNHMLFGAGAITGSFVFFFSLGYGARFLAPLFKNPRAWKVLEFVIGMIMASIAVSLVI